MCIAFVHSVVFLCRFAIVINEIIKDMKANELRIGNYFHPCYEKDGLLLPDELASLQVGAVNKFGTVAAIYPEQHKAVTFEHPAYVGIRLSVEWLIMFGFERQPILEDDFALKKSLIRNWAGGVWLFKMNYWEAGKVIRYVHQLQNLYFALTGEELVINK